jgi:FtsH-binding integral membrane protein
MALGWNNPTYQARTVDQATIDAGLRQHMLSVFNYMTVALAITGLVAFVVAQMAVASYSPLRLTELGGLLYNSPLKWVIMLAPIGFVFLFAARVHKMSMASAQGTFWAFAAVMGLSLSSIFLVYTGASVTRVFFITSATFAATALFGYTTKRDLSKFGTFLIMGLIGIVIASLVNIFMESSALQFAISVIGVLVFTGLTAYDTQRIKEEYNEMYAPDDLGRMAIMGALSLYLNFINLFTMLMQLLGNKNE